MFHFLNFFRLVILTVMLFSSFIVGGTLRDTLDLKGEWQYRLHGAPSSIPGEGSIILPNTLDNAHKSLYNPESTHTSQLRREFYYEGAATYSRQFLIPDNWKDKYIELFIERTKPTTIFIDGEKIGSNSLTSTSQRYNLSDFLTPGIHLIDIIVNNADSIPSVVKANSNAFSESTQTNWNGILGKIFLEKKNSFHIKNIIISDDIKKDEISTEIIFSDNLPSGYVITGKIDNGNEVSAIIDKDCSRLDLNLPLPVNFEKWSAFHPSLFNINLEIRDSYGQTIDSYSIKTGIRNIKSQDKEITLNGFPLFLRGTVNAAVFPETGYSPLDKSYWTDYFTKVKDYGFNHVRFHSWTPPEAAFQAADEIGIYIQVELPIWGNLDRSMVFHNRFLSKELEGIMEEYACHPSFIMFSTGNELWGDTGLMGEYMTMAKEFSPRILTTYGSNVYLGLKGELGGEDFLVTSKIGNDTDKAVRGSFSFADSPSGGYFNSTYPNSFSKFSQSIQDISVPVISHEVGQYQTYPDFDEIDESWGNLKPDNLKEFKKQALKAGTFRKNKEFSEASAKWAAKLYKAEVEMALRTHGISGFQLYGLQDYPGQGTALIGLLNSHLQPKNGIDYDEWKDACNDITLLAEFPKFTFTEEDSVTIPIVVANYSENADSIGRIFWTTGFQEGVLEVAPGYGLIEPGSISLKIPPIDNPQKFTLSVHSQNNDIKNESDFFVFPKEIPEVKNVFITTDLEEALSLLAKDKRVILCPDSATTLKASIEPIFINDFWNYRMFRTICESMGLKSSPGTLGLLIDKKHPSLSKFPTDINTDWQWYSIIANSRPLIIDRLPKDFDPVIEVIDNIERNFRLALMLECNVGRGKLMILSSDLQKLNEYAEGKWFLQSVKEYMGGKNCNPEITLTPQQLKNLLTKPSQARSIKELKNEIYNSNWE